MREEIRQALREAWRQRGDLTRVHVYPAWSAHTPDEREARLVILDPAHSHATKASDSPGCSEAVKMLDEPGSSPRRCRNTLVFLAAHRNRLAELEQAVRGRLAWKPTAAEREPLNWMPCRPMKSAPNARKRRGGH